MRTNGVQTEVGNDFDVTPEQALASASVDEGTQEQEPAEEGSGNTDPDELRNSLTDDVDAEAPAAEEKPEVPAASSFVEVKGAGKTAKFNLKADDPNLVKTLQLGMVAKTWKEERDKAKNDLKANAAEISSLKEKASVWDELREHAQLGQYDTIVRAVLGDKYEDYERQRQHLEIATPDERWEHERKQLAAQAQLERNRYQRELEAERTANSKKDEVALERRLESMATREFTRHDFSKFGFNDDLQQQLSEDLWEGAWGMVNRYIEAKGLNPSDVSQDMLQRAFERKFARMTAAFKTAGETQTSQILEQKKQEARKQVAAAATERYPAQGNPESDALKGWDGRSAKSLSRTFKKLLG